VKFRDRSLPGPGSSVSRDWCSCLTEAKSLFFESCDQDHQANYYMLGIMLNEAFGSFRSGQTAAALESVSLAPGLCFRWMEPLSALLRALSEHARNYGTLPNTAPLQSANFKSPRAQNSARMSLLLSHVLLTQRAQFLRKVAALLDLAEDLTNEFSSSVIILDESPRDGYDVWELVDSLGQLHFDLNTCCTEALILLKSFLVALPESQMAAFQKTYRTHLRAARASRQRATDRARALRNGRVVYMGGE
jgi:hypothetical protein